MTFADQLARLRSAVTAGVLPRDLGDWVLRELAARADAVDRREARDQMLIEAARSLSPNGSTWARAVALQEEIAAVDRRTEPDIAQQLVADALDLDPAMPRSARQLFSILKSAPWRFQTEPTDTASMPSPLSRESGGSHRPAGSAAVPRRWRSPR